MTSRSCKTYDVEFQPTLSKVLELNLYAPPVQPILVLFSIDPEYSLLI